MGRISNVPLPEPNLVGIAAGIVLHRLRPWTLPGTRRIHRALGYPLIAAGTYLVLRSYGAAGQVRLAHPDRLVTTGPYAFSRNPMYVGWALLHVGVGAVVGYGWIIAGFPASAWWVHREVMREERALAEQFTDEFGSYRAAVPRYLGRAPSAGTRPTQMS